jgi:hypothetical protein
MAPKKPTEVDLSVLGDDPGPVPPDGPAPWEPREPTPDDLAGQRWREPSDAGTGFAEAGPSEMLTPDRVRELLMEAGAWLHDMAGHPALPEHWAILPDEADRLAGPLARISNRYSAIVAAGRFSDELLVSAGVGRWVIRNGLLSRALAKANAMAAEAAPDDTVAFLVPS